MNIRSLFTHGLRQYGVNQADDGGIVFRVHEVARIRNGVRQTTEINVRSDIFGHLHGFIVVALVSQRQAPLEISL